jgi:TPP-dependent pyruvate/acetoin dehydrogenase alpha subunit
MNQPRFGSIETETQGLEAIRYEIKRFLIDHRIGRDGERDRLAREIQATAQTLIDLAAQSRDQDQDSLNQRVIAVVLALIHERGL